MDLPKMSSGQATAPATIYPALFVDKPGDYRDGDTIAYVNRAEYLPLFEAAPDLLRALQWLVAILPDPELDPDTLQRQHVEAAKAAIRKATGNA